MLTKFCEIDESIYDEICKEKRHCKDVKTAIDVSSNISESVILHLVGKSNVKSFKTKFAKYSDFMYEYRTPSRKGTVMHYNLKFAVCKFDEKFYVCHFAELEKYFK